MSKKRPKPPTQEQLLSRPDPNDPELEMQQEINNGFWDDIEITDDLVNFFISAMERKTP